jgi:hypothetical protein
MLRISVSNSRLNALIGREEGHEKCCEEGLEEGRAAYSGVVHEEQLSG